MIDVHAHFIPDGYRAALHAADHGQPDGMAAIPSWSAAEHIVVMDHVGIEVSTLSISSPGVWSADLPRHRRAARPWAASTSTEPGRASYGRLDTMTA